MIELGQEGRDKITGFKGLLTARYQYITGCDQYILTPKIVKGKCEASEVFDEGRIEIIGKGVAPMDVQIKGNLGGPQRDVPTTHK